jgi:hypothetical protein
MQLSQEIKLKNYSYRALQAYMQCVEYFLKFWIKTEDKLNSIDRNFIKKSYNIRTTQIYTHVMQPALHAISSPLDTFTPHENPLPISPRSPFY